MICLFNRCPYSEVFGEQGHIPQVPRPTQGAQCCRLAHNPNGGMARKYCYWFNSEYVTNIIKQQDNIENI